MNCGWKSVLLHQLMRKLLRHGLLEMYNKLDYTVNMIMPYTSEFGEKLNKHVLK